MHTAEYLGMPIHQPNANLPESLQMRVGIPHRGGALACRAFNEGLPAMVSASAFWNARAQRFVIPEITSLIDLDWSLDSAGFTSMSRWARQGHQAGMAGIYPWKLPAYMELASLMRPSWWSAPDLCTESAPDQAEVDRRIDVTATLLEGTLRLLYSWQEQLARTSPASVVADLLRPPVPVIQGACRASYQRSLEFTLDVWQRWTPWLAMPALIGVGSMCRRSLDHKTLGVHAIVASLEPMLPAGTKLHLFGVKGRGVSRLKLNPAVASLDSMAHDFGSRVSAFRAGRPNDMAHRADNMARWMADAGRRAAPAPGDQPRLDFTAEV